MTELYLLRHAECDANCRREYIWGRTNESPLTRRGEKQAAALEERMRRENIIFDAVYSSPAIRAWETIILAVPYYSRDKIIIAPELQELDQGVWTGRLRSEIYTPEQLTIINYDNWNFSPLKGESQVGVRVYGLVDEAIIQSSEKPKNVAFSMHGVAIKCLLTLLLESDKSMAWRWHIDNASITQLKYEDGCWWPIRINDATHIQGIY